MRPAYAHPEPQKHDMTAITSQTFHYEPSFSATRTARAVAQAAVAGGRLLARWLTPTAAARPHGRSGEAEEVRVMARNWEKTDPGFAADLYAAAARHEGLAD